MGKTKVVPLKGDPTISRLELKALTEAVQLADEIVKQKENRRHTFYKVKLMTDNETTKAWVQSKPGKKDFGQFVNARIRLIHSICQTWCEEGISVELGYIRSEDNPADVASREFPKKNLKGTCGGRRLESYVRRNGNPNKSGGNFRR